MVRLTLRRSSARSAPISYTPPVKPPPPSTSAVFDRFLRRFAVFRDRSRAPGSSLTTFPMRLERYPRRPMRRLLAVVIVGLLALPTVANALDAASIKRSWDKRERRMGSRAGAYVVDLSTNHVLYSRTAERALAPASNEKLLTTASALVRLGPATTLSTIVRAAPDAVLEPDGTLQGDLILVGAGDPSLNDVALRDLVAQLRRVGIARVTGAIVGDESVFDTRRGSYDSAFGYDSDLGGALGGLTWGHGRYDSRGPAYYAASRLRYFLKLSKVRVSSKVAVAPAATVTTPALATHASPTIAELVSITNHPSDNFYAEMLLKLLGARGGTGGSARAGATPPPGGPEGLRGHREDGRRLRAVARGPRLHPPGRPPAGHNGRPTGGRAVPRLARRAGRMGHAPAPHDGHHRPRRLPREDRHAHRCLGAQRLLPRPRGPHDRLLAARERGLRGLREEARGPDGPDARPLRGLKQSERAGLVENRHAQALGLG